jgi:hypothetical protein
VSARPVLPAVPSPTNDEALDEPSPLDVPAFLRRQEG